MGAAVFDRLGPGIQRVHPRRSGLGVGIFLIAVGAILTFAVNVSSSSANVAQSAGS
jgi:hypothetical protein